MERVIERCAGLDVHKKTVAVCVRVPGTKRGERVQHVRTFGTTAAELLALRDWLDTHGVTHVAMESTGVYWKPVYYVLEEAFTCVLANAAHVAQVPGRKTDVQDCMWIAQLLEHGLVRGSFVPPVPIREPRDLTRYRKALVEEHTREANRLHKVLEDAGIKLASVATDVLGVSGRAMLKALVAGTTDPNVLALIAEIGVDMSVFPSDRHLASWAGLCPGNNESAGRRPPRSREFRVPSRNRRLRGRAAREPVQCARWCSVRPGCSCTIRSVTGPGGPATPFSRCTRASSW